MNFEALEARRSAWKSCRLRDNLTPLRDYLANLSCKKEESQVRIETDSSDSEINKIIESELKNCHQSDIEFNQQFNK